LSAMKDGSDALAGVDALVCDLDGVIYRGDEPVKGSPEAVRALRDRGLRVLFCTNNARPTIADYISKLEGMGIACSRDDLVTSPVVAAEVVGDENPGARVVVVGGPGLHEAIESNGLVVVAGAPADVVVVGMTPDFHYDDIARANSAIRAGATFYATNDDATYPAENGLRPGAGALVAAIAVASGREPTVLGKPHRPMMESVLKRLPQDATVAMVGDRPETDLDGARAMGWRTILVLSGVTNEAGAARLDPRPDVVVRSLADLMPRQ
jgi:HAD superfamily hydrolase (TIGR01450 family)